MATAWAMPQLTLVTVPAMAGGLPPDSDHVHVFRDEHGTPCASGALVAGQPWLYQLPLVAFRFDVPTATVTAFSAAPPELVEDSFLRCALPLAWHLQGGEVLHAAAVRAESGIVALCGPAGTGKSTTARGLAGRGLPLWADDAVAVDASRQAAVAWPLPFRSRLLPDAAARLGDIPGSAAMPAMDPEPLAAVCLLERTDEPGAPVVAVTPRTGADALSMLLANAYYFDTGDPARLRATTQAYLDLATRAPLLTVRFRPGLPELDQVLDAVIAAIPASRARHCP